jgi:hypothetical protein
MLAWIPNRITDEYTNLANERTKHATNKLTTDYSSKHDTELTTDYNSKHATE